MEKCVRETLISSITDHTIKIEEIHLFHHWVVVKAGRYEMSTCFTATAGLEPPRDTWLGDLIQQNAAEIAQEYLASSDVLRITVGMACLKCVIPQVMEFRESSALDPFVKKTLDHPTCFIGHFQEAAQLRDEGRPVSIVELQPRPGDIHWDDSHAVLSQAELVFMTGLTLVNGTFGEVIRRTPHASVRIAMGPTVPLSADLFTLGLQVLGTSRIMDVTKTLRYFGMGGASIKYAPLGALQKISISRSSMDL